MAPKQRVSAYSTKQFLQSTDNSRNYSDFTASRSHFDLNFFAKMDRDYLTTFMMLVTLSVIFIVDDDNFARNEFVFWICLNS